VRACRRTDHPIIRVRRRTTPGTADVAPSAALCHGVAVAENYVAELDFGAPRIDPEAFVAPTAVVVGAVTMGPKSSIWYGAVARADFETIEIGEGSNVQDGCTLHSDAGFPLVLGKGVTVGHRVVLHGARVDDDVLVGMGSVVMNGAHIGSGSIVAAGAVVTQGTEVPPGSVVAGIPAKVVRPTTDDDLLHIRGNAASYTDRLPSARRVRPVVRTRLPPSGPVPGDDMP
jgi:carbonic anhydrase/acetyltransferase-like protein (isoleucine patch superfamily)